MGYFELFEVLKLSTPQSTWSRAVAKSAIWKVVGIVTLIGVSYAAGVTFLQIGKITVAYHVVTLFLYIIHERAWDRTRWGKVIK